MYEPYIYALANYLNQTRCRHGFPRKKEKTIGKLRRGAQSAGLIGERSGHGSSSMIIFLKLSGTAEASDGHFFFRFPKFFHWRKTMKAIVVHEIWRSRSY